MLFRSVFYSGTVSAAIEASMLGIPAIAISLGAFENLDYTLAARFAVDTAGIVAKQGLPQDTILNVNVPAMPAADIAGISITRLGLSRFSDHFEKRLDPRGKAYYWLTGEMQLFEEGPETDLGAIRANMISITPIHLDLTHHGLMKSIRGWGMTLHKGNDGEISCRISE